jgi:hypothetical protein
MSVTPTASRTYKIEDAIAALQKLLRTKLPGVSSAPNLLMTTAHPGTVQILTYPPSLVSTLIGDGELWMVYDVTSSVMVHRENLATTIDLLIDYAELIPLLLSENITLERTVDDIRNIRFTGIIPSEYEGLEMLGYQFSIEFHMRQAGTIIGTDTIRTAPTPARKIRTAISGFQKLIRAYFPEVRLAPDIAQDQTITGPTVIVYPGTATHQIKSSAYSLTLTSIICEVHIPNAMGITYASDAALKYGDLISIMIRDNPTFGGTITGLSGDAQFTADYSNLGWGLFSNLQESTGWRFNIPVKFLQGE